MAKRTRTAKTQADVARALGVSRKTVSQWARQWPFGKRGPFKLGAITQWRAENFAPAGGEKATPADFGEGDQLTPMQRAELLVRQRRAEKLLREIGLLDTKYIEREAVTTQIQSVIHNTRAVLLGEARGIADALDSMGLLMDGARRDVEAEINRRLESVCRQFADGLHDAADHK